jgi:hypothetical protein
MSHISRVTSRSSGSSRLRTQRAAHAPINMIRLELATGIGQMILEAAAGSGRPALDPEFLLV